MIQSVQNEEVKFLTSLQRRKGRKEHGRYLLEGRRLVQEALRRGARLEKFYLCPEHYRQEVFWPSNLPCEEISAAVLRKISDTEEPQGLIALGRMEAFDWADISLGKKETFLILDRIQDPGNLGAILRSALASGVSSVCLTEGTVDLYSPKVLRATMGMIFSQTVLQGKSPQEVTDFCRRQGLYLLTSVIDGHSIFDAQYPIDRPLALVIGNESEGVCAHFRSWADLRVALPMVNGVESLNAAVAAGICFYEIGRRRSVF